MPVAHKIRWPRLAVTCLRCGAEQWVQVAPWLARRLAGLARHEIALHVECAHPGCAREVPVTVGDVLRATGRPDAA
jgi:hypothetical protein